MSRAQVFFGIGILGMAILAAQPAAAQIPQCFGDAECDDGDPCTTDRCDTSLGCVNTPDLTDSDGDGIPDCITCPPVDIVFVMDTSGTMEDEGAALCGQIANVVAALGAGGVTVDHTILGINETPGGQFGCLVDSVTNLLGTVVPGNPPCCPALVDREDWASATAIVAANFAWNANSVRVIVPLGDEGPYEGDPCNDPGDDRDAINNAIAIANANSVFVAPITGTGSSVCVQTLAAALAAGTGTIAFTSTDPAADLAGAIQDIVIDVCLAVGAGPLGDGDGCPFNPAKSDPGACGCGIPDADTDADGTPDCNDPTPGGDGAPPPAAAAPPCAAGVGMANLVGFGMLCVVGLIGIRHRRWHNR